MWVWENIQRIMCLQTIQTEELLSVKNTIHLNKLSRLIKKSK